MYGISSRKTTSPMMAMSPSWQVLPKRPISSGAILQKLQKEERAKGGVLDMDTDIVSTLTSHAPGYICEECKDLEKIVGLQTDKPLKRAFMPFGGIKMAEEACQTYGYTPDPELHKIFTEYHKTHNQGVFDAYTPEMQQGPS